MHFVKLTLKLIFLLLTFNYGNSQEELCRSCYVWEFTNEDGDRNEMTKILSNDFEDILSRKAGCTALQRSRFASLYEQVKNENGIVSLSTITENSLNQLKITRAKNVVFGKISKDFQGNISLRVSFESLETSQLKSNTIFLIGENAYNFDKRRKLLSEFVDIFLERKREEPAVNLPPTDPPPKDYPFTENLGALEIKIDKCVRKGSDVLVEFTLLSKNKDSFVRLWATPHCKLYDDTGEEYYSKRATIGSTTSNIASRELIANVPTKGSIIFLNVSTNAKEVKRLDLRFSVKGGQSDFVRFQNLGLK